MNLVFSIIKSKLFRNNSGNTGLQDILLTL